MKSFDHRDVGTSAAQWSASGILDRAPALDLTELRHLIVIAAHPDDETLGAGALMSLAAAQGARVTVMVATAGEASHPESPTLRPRELARIRRAEVTAAIGRLAPAAVMRQLDLGDGRLAESMAALVAEILVHVPVSGSISGQVDVPGQVDSQARAEISAGSTWLVAPWLHDRHPDHAACAAAARLVADSAGCRLLEYPLWAWHWAIPGDGTFESSSLLVLNLSDDAVQAKNSAMAEHRSQLEPLSAAVGDEAVVPTGFADHFRQRREVFIETVPVDAAGAGGLGVGSAGVGSGVVGGAGIGSAAGADRGTIVGDGASLDRAFFDDFYAGGADPWGFENRWYEERKRAITFASLPSRRFRSALEPGCAIGVLTKELALRCDQLLATDISEKPLRIARQRLADSPGVRFARLRVPQEWPAGQYDLIVLSEIGYYCAPKDLTLLIDAATSSMTSDGVLLACHWRHPVREYPLTGDAVHEQLRRESGLVVLAEHLEEDFRLDVLVRAPAPSVARQDGLLS